MSKQYVVVKAFADLQDNSYAYHEDDLYPREGVEVSEERIEELSSKNNLRKEVLIKEVEATENEKVEDGKASSGEFPKDTGGGWFLLSNGEKVQGKEKAIEAENALQK